MRRNGLPVSVHDGAAPEWDGLDPLRVAQVSRILPSATNARSSRVYRSTSKHAAAAGRDHLRLPRCLSSGPTESSAPLRAGAGRSTARDHRLRGETAKLGRG